MRQILEVAEPIAVAGDTIALAVLDVNKRTETVDLQLEKVFACKSRHYKAEGESHYSDDPQRIVHNVQSRSKTQDRAGKPGSGVSDLYRPAKTVHEEIQPLTAKDVPVFLAEAKQHCATYLRTIPVCDPYGAAVGELAGLQWGDIDFNGKYLIVGRSVVRGRIEKTKTSKTRRVDMSDALILELEALRRTRKAEYLAAGKTRYQNGYFSVRAASFGKTASLSGKIVFFFRETLRVHVE